ncbi:O-antigen/teichoic acid export membrane protein [Micromonospora sp. M71_S20]|nr:O-antigen/teichoic acid export membrane protein [Micromonospora sp. M71_S20]
MSGSPFETASRCRRLARRVRIAVRAPSLGRAPWAVLAAALSSVGNLLLSLTIARLAPIDDLGRFALAFSLYVLATGLCRAMVTDAVLAASVGAADASSRVVLVGVGCAVPVLIGGLLDGSGYLVLTAVALPGLLLHEHCRVVGVGLDHPRPPCQREAAWTGVTALAAVLGLVGVLDPVTVYAVWAGAGALSGYATALLVGDTVRPAWRLDRPGTRASVSYGLQFLVTAGSAQLALTAVAVVVGVAVVGALGAGRTLLGPAALLVGSATALVLPRLAAARATSASIRRRSAVWAAVALLAVTAPAGLVALLLPDDVGRTVLGDNWRHAEELLALLAVEVIAAGAAMVAFAGHRVEGAARRTLLIGAALGAVRIPAVTVGAMLRGATGAAVALALMGLLSMVTWWVSYLDLLRVDGRQADRSGIRAGGGGAPAMSAARVTGDS